MSYCPQPLSALFLLVFCISFSLEGADSSPSPLYWPQFRGPNASGISKGAKPPVKISPSENVVWKTDVPWSPSSPSIWAERIFLTTVGQEELQVHCYDRDTGKLRWKKGVQPKEIEIFHRTDGSPAASTSATDGHHVVSYFGSFGLICHDMEGHELWRHPMPAALSGGRFGTGTSPIIVDQSVILLRDVRSLSTLMAFHVATGKLQWESPRPEANGSFGTPIVWNNQGTQELIIPGSLQLKGYSLNSGRERWLVDGLTTFACTTPVLGDGRLYFGAWAPGGIDNPWPDWSEFRTAHDKDNDGEIALIEISADRRDFYRALDIDEDDIITETDWNKLKKASSLGVNMLIAVEPGGQGDITDTHVPWTFKKGLPYVPSPLFYQGRIYMIRDGGIISSLNARTGQPYYAEERLKAMGSYYASPVAADGRIYLASLTGKLTIVEAGGDLPKTLHQADFGERIFATPALAGDNLYLRTESRLYAFQNSHSSTK